MTPSQTAVMFAEGSAKRMGATKGTTTTAISMKSRKNPNIKMTAITTINFAQNPPGILDRNSFTSSSPPNPLKADVSMVAPRSIINTIEVVFEVSSMTLLRASSIRKVLHALQNTAIKSPITAMVAMIIAMPSSELRIFFMFNG